MDKFVNYHVHDQRSLLDGMIPTTDLIDRSMELGQKAVAITNHGNMYSIVNMFQYAQKVEQKAIAGCEVYIVDDHTSRGNEGDSDENTSRNHLILLAKNMEGYKKLNRICSKGFTDGFYYKPRVDNGILEEFMDAENENDLIGTSACLASRISQYILHGEYEKADALIQYYWKLFNGNFYLEIQPCEMNEQYIVNKYLMEYSKEHSIPLSMATDAHYLRREDKDTHDVLLCMQSSNLMSNVDRWAFQGNSYYIMNREEVLSFFNNSYKYKKLRMLSTKKKSNSQYYYKTVYDYEGDKFNYPDRLFSNFDRVEEEGSFDYNTLDKKQLEQACDATVEIADKCNVSFSYDKHYLPKIDIPTDNKGFNKWNEHQEELGLGSKPNEAYLKYLCIQGLKTRFKNASKEEKKKLQERLLYELNVINSMGFPDYFLIYYDIANFCRENNIPMGPGRGCFIQGCNVITNNGIKDISNVNVGDVVIAHDELQHKVISTHQYDIKEEIMTVSTKDKIINGVTLDHKIYAIKHKDFDNGIRTPSWYSVGELQEGDYICEVDAI